MKTDTSHGNSLADFTTDFRVILLSAMALIIGAASAAVAWVLIWLINVITNVAFFHRFSSVAATPQELHPAIWMIFIPVIGSLIIGLMARYGSPKIRGHGIPEALEAILIGRSRMEPRVALLKPISSAISIGTGGPFGAEGPIIMTGGAFGSLFAQMLHLSSAERKTLLVAGAAGGMAAVFATPVAAVLLAVELLLFEWKPRSFIPVAISAIVASALRVPLLGGGPVFPVAPHGALGGTELAFALAVGIGAGLLSGLLTTLVYATEDLFQKLPIHWMWWPAIGAVFVGVGGYLDPRVLGVGYGIIHSLLDGRLLGMAALGLLIGKALVWSIALGSGTSGGVLAPLLMMGGALGAIVSHWIPTGDASLWAMVGMAAIMGGTMRSPFTGMVFLLELTRDLNALPALMIGSVAALGVTVLLLKRSILTEKLARRGHHVTREYSVDLFHLLRVSEVMDSDPPFRPGCPSRNSPTSSRAATRISRAAREPSWWTTRDCSRASSRAATSSARCKVAWATTPSSKPPMGIPSSRTPTNCSTTLSPKCSSRTSVACRSWTARIRGCCSATLAARTSCPRVRAIWRRKPSVNAAWPKPLDDFVRPAKFKPGRES
jgi:H+/Cl- antiporter ClcA